MGKEPRRRSGVRAPDPPRQLDCHANVIWLLADDDERTTRWAERLEGEGHQCEAFATVECIGEQVAVNPPAVIAVLRHLGEDEAERLSRVTLLADPGCCPLVIHCAEVGDPPVRMGADVVLIGEAAWQGLSSVVCSRAAQWSGHDPLEALFVEHGLLGKPRGEALTDLIRQIHQAAAADVACFLLDRPEGLVIETSLAELSEEHRTTLAKWAALAAAGAAVLVVPSLVADDSGCPFATVVAVPLRAEDGTELGLLCLAWSGWHDLSLPRQVLLRRAARRLGRELHWRDTQDRLVDEVEELQALGGLDPTLGVWSRPTLLRLAEMKAAASARTGDPLSAVVIRISGMKQLIETFGHSTGDDVLRHVAEVIMYVVRAYDSLGRLGADELAILFDGAETQGASSAVGRIQRLLESQPFVTDGGLEHWVATTASITEVSRRENGQQALARATIAARQARSSEPVVVEARPGHAPSSLPAPPSLEGKTLGGTYRVLRRIGAGGGGGVYRGEDLGLRRPVAVKVLLPHFAKDKRLVDRFREEAAILASLRHPNLVNVYSFGLHKQHVYFIMELVEGETVRGTIDRGAKDGSPVPLARVRVVVEQMASALDTLHRSGVVHRDVKPDNILVDPFRQRAVLVDVGIARRRGADVCVAGTPGYMAPEVFTEVDPGPAVDVFGLAATIYEMLTLRSPWRLPEDVSLLAQWLRVNPPKRPSLIRKSLAPIDEVLLKALAFDPHERWQSAPELAEAFLAALADVDELADEHVTASIRTFSQSPSSRRPHFSSASPSFAIEPQTRGVVFRSVSRVFGLRPTAQWRDVLSAQGSGLAEVLGPSLPPLDWAPTASLVRVLQAGPPDGRPARRFARDLGRATVRATFRRFFPASITMLAPRGTLRALHEIWPHYHSWGTLEVVTESDDRAVVRVTDKPAEPILDDLLAGMLEQMVVLSGGAQVTLRQTDTSPTDQTECRFEISWKWSPTSVPPLSDA